MSDPGLAFPKPPRRLPASKRRLPELRKTERAVLVRACDTAFAGLVKALAGYKCEVHGRRCKDDLDCAHGEGRAKVATRWSRANAWAACRAAHQQMHNDPDAWEAFRHARLGAELFEKMRRQSHGSLQHELVDILAELKAGRFLQGDR